MAERLVIQGGELEGAYQAVVGLRGDFENATGRSSDAADSAGYEPLAAELRNVTSSWRIHRGKMIDSLEVIEGHLKGAIDTFGDVDQRMAQNIAPDVQLAPSPAGAHPSGTSPSMSADPPSSPTPPVPSQPEPSIGAPTHAPAPPSAPQVPAQPIDQAPRVDFTDNDSPTAGGDGSGAEPLGHTQSAEGGIQLPFGSFVAGDPSASLDQSRQLSDLVARIRTLLDAAGVDTAGGAFAGGAVVGALLGLASAGAGPVGSSLGRPDGSGRVRPEAAGDTVRRALEELSAQPLSGNQGALGPQAQEPRTAQNVRADLAALAAQGQAASGGDAGAFRAGSAMWGENVSSLTDPFGGGAPGPGVVGAPVGSSAGSAGTGHVEGGLARSLDLASGSAGGAQSVSANPMGAAVAPGQHPPQAQMAAMGSMAAMSSLGHHQQATVASDDERLKAARRSLEQLKQERRAPDVETAEPTRTERSGRMHGKDHR